MGNTTYLSSSYSVLTFITDELRRTEIPVGIALWSSREGLGSVQIRTLSEDVKVSGFRHEWFPYVDMVSSQLHSWLSEERLPYGTEKLRPQDDAWWSHIRNYLVHRVRLSEPKAIDCKDIKEEADLLFEAIVQPQKTETERKQRVDSALTKTLGSLSKNFSRGSVRGFGGREVPVKRLLEYGHRILILEGVNLASTDAEKETDALVSKLQRINEVGTATGGTEMGSRHMTAFVGYLTSPGGLNGEASLVRWIEQKAGAKTFDLVRDRDKFLGSVESEMSEIRP